MNEATETLEQPHSCRITLGMNGKWSGELKVYSDNIDDAVRLALSKAQELELVLKTKNEGST